MSLPRIVSREEWLAARTALLDLEKALTRTRDALNKADGRVFHTYSQYARGLESTGGSYYFLDLTVLGRQEDWEEPKGRTEAARAAQPDFAS